MEELSKQEIRDAIAIIESAYPEIANIKVSDSCCRGHLIQDIEREHGAALARMWQRLDTAKWLLGVEDGDEARD
jgi:hypothetical protein